MSINNLSKVNLTRPSLILFAAGLFHAVLRWLFFSDVESTRLGGEFFTSDLSRGKKGVFSPVFITIFALLLAVVLFVVEKRNGERKQAYWVAFLATLLLVAINIILMFVAKMN